MGERKASDSTSTMDTKVSRSKDAAADPKFSLEDLKLHVECPICISVPRDGVMLQCINGHNICSVCKVKIGHYAKCPQGRCYFNTPPAKNFTVANMIEKFPFKWPCRNQQTKCAFEGTKAALALHEATCQTMKCPSFHCGETVSLGSVVEHFGTVHKDRAMENVSIMLGEKIPNEPRLRNGSPWPEIPLKLPDVNWALFCSQWHEGELLVWLWALLDEEEAERLECRLRRLQCRIEMCEECNSEENVIFSPVYPLTWDRQRIMRDQRCARITPWALASMGPNEDVAAKHEHELSIAKFAMHLSVRKKPNNE